MSIFNTRLVKPLALGIFSSVISSFIIMVIGALMIKNIDINETIILIISLFSMTIGTFFGGLIAAKINKEKGFLVGALNGILFFILNTIISFVLNSDSMTIISIIKLALFIISSMIGGIIGVNYNRKRKI